MRRRSRATACSGRCSRGSSASAAGTDEQFAATFVLLARAIGVDARLAAGFVVEEPTDIDDDHLEGCGGVAGGAVRRWRRHDVGGVRPGARATRTSSPPEPEPESQQVDRRAHRSCPHRRTTATVRTRRPSRSRSRHAAQHARACPRRHAAGGGGDRVAPSAAAGRRGGDPPAEAPAAATAARHRSSAGADPRRVGGDHRRARRRRTRHPQGRDRHRGRAHGHVRAHRRRPPSSCAWRRSPSRRPSVNRREPTCWCSTRSSAGRRSRHRSPPSVRGPDGCCGVSACGRCAPAPAARCGRRAESGDRLSRFVAGSVTTARRRCRRSQPPSPAARAATAAGASVWPSV